MSKISFLIDQLQAIQSDHLWMGDSFDKKLKSIDGEDAFVQPMGQVHSVAQILAHISAWKEDAILKINYGRGELMDNHEKNWPDNDELKAIGWSDIVNRFQQSHTRLIETLNEYDDQLFDGTYFDQDFKAEYPMRFMLDGLLHHDLYHLGQIGLVMSMIRRSK